MSAKTKVGNRIRAIVYMTPQIAERLDSYCAETGFGASEALNVALDQFLPRKRGRKPARPEGEREVVRHHAPRPQTLDPEEEEKGGETPGHIPTGGEYGGDENNDFERIDLNN